MKTVQRLAITIVIGGYLWPLSCAAQFDTIYRFGGARMERRPKGWSPGRAACSMARLLTAELWVTGQCSS